MSEPYPNFVARDTMLRATRERPRPLSQGAGNPPGPGVVLCPRQWTPRCRRVNRTPHENEQPRPVSLLLAAGVDPRRGAGGLAGARVQAGRGRALSGGLRLRRWFDLPVWVLEPGRRRDLFQSRFH